MNRPGALLERHRKEMGKDRHHGHKHFVKEEPSDYDAGSLRKKHVASLLSEKAPRLTAMESKALLLAGNAEHVAALDGAPLSPSERHARIRRGEADYLVVACSDARILRLDSEKDSLVGLFIRIAGNVVPEKGTASFEEMREAVQMVRKDGAVIFEGHDGGPGCGAVNERVKWIEAGMPHTGSKSLDALLRRVVGDNPAHNAIAQLTTARETLGLGERPSAALVYDWEHAKHRHADPIEIVSANHSDVVEILKDSWNRRHYEVASRGDLPRLLKSQRPHAVAVGTNDLPFSVATLFHAEQNEVFSTTGSEHGLDEMDVASILYAIEHLGLHHIPFVAPGSGKDRKGLTSLFGRWEKQLRQIKVHGVPMIAKMLDSGELRISRLMYDLRNGAVWDLSEEASA